mmetsp:Transcript_24541/g.24813  ORF Transcript_24541/g.24813 Transcript_24541/m.24813 type:complete len:182 (+) Transcript_24541:1-546(+)
MQDQEEEDQSNSDDDSNDEVVNDNRNSESHTFKAKKKNPKMTSKSSFTTKGCFTSRGCPRCLLGSAYKMGHCVSCPLSRYYDPNVKLASSYTEHQNNLKRQRDKRRRQQAANDSGNETVPTSNKRQKSTHDSSVSKREKSTSIRCLNNFMVSEDRTRRIITNALIRYQFQDRNHKIRSTNP